MAFDVKYSEVFSGLIQSVHVTVDTCMAKMVQLMWTSQAAESKGLQNGKMEKLSSDHDNFLISEPIEIKSSKPKLFFKAHHFCEGRPLWLPVREGHCGYPWVRSFWVPVRDGHCGYQQGTFIVSTQEGRPLLLPARDGHCGYPWRTVIVSTREGRPLWIPAPGTKSPGTEVTVVTVLQYRRGRPSSGT